MRKPGKKSQKKPGEQEARGRKTVKRRSSDKVEKARRRRRRRRKN